MEIKFNNKPVTIKTIEIDGKKLTKQLVKQFKLDFLPCDDIKIHLRDLNNEISLITGKAVDHNGLREFKVLGYINMKFDKEDVIINSIKQGSKDYNTDVFTVLFIHYDEPNVIKRAYLKKKDYLQWYLTQYTQIFI